MPVNTTQQELLVKVNAQNNTGAAFRGVEADAKKAFGKTSTGGLPMLAGGAAAAVAAVGAAVLAVGAGLVTASEKSAAFEKDMARVGALSGATKSQFNDLKAAALELGSSTAFSASEAAQGMQALAMAGFSVNDTIQAMPAVLSAASAAQSDLGDTADIVSNIMSGFNISADETGTIADVLTATFTSSNTTLESLGETMKYVGPIAVTQGQSLEMMAAAAGLLGSAGIQGSEAGTALRGSLLRLAAPTTAAQELLDKYNITLRDANGEMLPLPDLIGNVQQGMEGLNPADQTKLLKELIGTEAMGGFSVLLQAGPDEIQKYANKLENSLGRAASVATQQTDTLAGSYASLNSKFDTLLIQIGDKINPIIKTMVDDYLIPAAGAVGEWVGQLGDLGTIFDETVEAVEGFGSSLWTTVDGFFSDPDFRAKVIEQMGGTLDAMITAGSDLISAGLTLWAEVVTSYAKIIWTPFEAFFKVVWSNIKDAATDAMNAIGQSVTDGINAIIDGYNVIGDKLGLSIKNIDFTPLTKDAPYDTEQAWADTKTNVSKEFNNIKDAYATASAAIVKAAGESGVKVVNASKNTRTNSSNALKQIAVDFEKNVATELPKKAEEGGGNAVQGIAKGIEKNKPALEEKTKGLFSGVFDGVDFGGMFVGAIDDISRGASFKQAAAGAGEALGFALGGPLGGAIARSITAGLTQGSSKRAAKGVVGAAFAGGRLDLIDREVVKDAFKSGGAGRVTKLSDQIDKEFPTATQTQKSALLASFIAMADGKYNQQIKGTEIERVANEALENELVRRALQDANRASAYSDFDDYIQGLAFGDGGSAHATQDTPDVLVPPTQPPPPPPPPPAPRWSTAAQYLKNAGNRLSKSQLQSIGWNNVGAGINELYDAGDVDLRNIGSQLKTIIRGYTPAYPSEAQARSSLAGLGYDIVAAQGYHGVLNKPTTILAGEAGPERVDISPMGGSATGGSGHGQTVMHFNINVSTPDTGSMKRWVERDLFPMIQKQMVKQGRAGEGLVPQKAVMAA